MHVSLAPGMCAPGGAWRVTVASAFCLLLIIVFVARGTKADDVKIK